MRTEHVALAHGHSCKRMHAPCKHLDTVHPTRAGVVDVEMHTNTAARQPSTLSETCDTQASADTLYVLANAFVPAWLRCAWEPAPPEAIRADADVPMPAHAWCTPGMLSG